jgi:hypothetical protein
MTGTATYYAELTTLAQIAGQLGHSDGASYAERGRALRQTMIDKLFDPTLSIFDSGSQTAQAMGLVLGLFPDDHLAKALDLLVDDIRAHQNHTSAGDIGFHYVVRALTGAGRSDVLYEMLIRTDKPAYLEQIKNGATALTEAWDSARDASQNHFMLGHAEIWFYQGLGGLDIDLSRGRGSIILAPQPVEWGNDQSASYEGVFGRLRTRLRRYKGRWRLTAEVPPGQTVSVVLPKSDPIRVREGRVALIDAKGVGDVAGINGDTIIVVQPGTYEFNWS